MRNILPDIKDKDKKKIPELIDKVGEAKIEPIEHTIMSLQKENEKLKKDLAIKDVLLNQLEELIIKQKKLIHKNTSEIKKLEKSISNIEKEKKELSNQFAKASPNSIISSEKAQPSDNGIKIKDVEKVLQAIDEIEQQCTETPNIENITGKLGNRINELSIELKNTQNQNKEYASKIQEYRKKFRLFEEQMLNKNLLIEKKEKEIINLQSLSKKLEFKLQKKDLIIQKLKREK